MKKKFEFVGSIARAEDGGWDVSLRSTASGNEEFAARVEVLEDAPAKIAQAVWDAAQVYFE